MPTRKQVGGGATMVI